MCFQAFCLEIICSDPQGVLQVLPIREFSTILSCLLVLACSFGRSGCFKCCVNFFIIWWLLSSKERVQWALHWFLFQHTLAHVSIHQRKIDNDLRKEITKAAILYPTMRFVSSRTQTFIHSARELFTCSIFNIFALGNSLFVSRPFLVQYKKKIKCISQRVIYGGLFWSKSWQ